MLPNVIDGDEEHVNLYAKLRDSIAMAESDTVLFYLKFYSTRRGLLINARQNTWVGARVCQGINQYNRREPVRRPRTIPFYPLVMPTQYRSKMEHRGRTAPRRPHWNSS
jgi:hypothetical protein